MHENALLLCSYGTAEVRMIPRHHFLTCEKQYLGNMSAFVMQTEKKGKNNVHKTNPVHKINIYRIC